MTVPVRLAAGLLVLPMLVCAQSPAVAANQEHAIAASKATGAPFGIKTSPKAPGESVKTKLFNGDLLGTVYQYPNSFAKVISTPVKCPDAGCTIEATMTVQYSIDASNNDHGICLEIDGEIQEPGCPRLGGMPENTGHGYGTTTTTAIASGLGKGKHRVKVHFISDYGASLYMYFVTVRVYPK